MVQFRVDDMTCGHCVSKINKAIKGLDVNAAVAIDLKRHLVNVEGADAGEVEAAIKEAGYTPVLSD